MYLEQLHYLETLSKYPSINQASEALFISQPSLSRAITKLENELNLQLVQRTNKKCVLTEDGLEVLKHASKITEEIANIYKYASERNEQSEVRFVSIPGICDSLIIDAINLYQKTNQNTKIHLKFDSSESILQTLKYSNDDFALISVIHGVNKEPFFELVDSFETEFLFSNDVLYWMSSEHPLADSAPCYQTYIPYLYNAVASNTLTEGCTTNTLVFASSSLQKNLMLQNNAILFLPHNLTYKDPDIASGKIITKPSDIPVTIDYYLIYKKSNKLSQIIKEFSKIFHSLFSAYFEK